MPAVTLPKNKPTDYEVRLYYFLTCTYFLSFLEGTRRMLLVASCRCVCRRKSERKHARPIEDTCTDRAIDG